MTGTYERAVGKASEGPSEAQRLEHAYGDQRRHAPAQTRSTPLTHPRGRAGQKSGVWRARDRRPHTHAPNAKTARGVRPPP